MLQLKRANFKKMKSHTFTKSFLKYICYIKGQDLRKILVLCASESYLRYFHLQTQSYGYKIVYAPSSVSRNISTWYLLVKRVVFFHGGSKANKSVFITKGMESLLCFLPPQLMNVFAYFWSYL